MNPEQHPIPFRDMVEQARHIRQLYTNLEQSTTGTPNNLTLGMMGDLCKLITPRKGVRPTPDTPVHDHPAHELSDMLWSTIIIADATEVNLEEAFPVTITSRLNALNGDQLR